MSAPLSRATDPAAAAGDEPRHQWGGEAIGDQPGTLTVRLRTEHFTERRARIRTEGFPIFPGDYVRLDVIDSGAGMDTETRDRIFEPFFTTKFLGRGLGLSAALGIVRGHRGAIGVRSEAGRGTTFTVLLPVVRGPRRVSRTSQEVYPEHDLQGAGTIMVVDDDDGVRSMAAGTLREVGYRVELAADGIEAVERGADRRLSAQALQPGTAGSQGAGCPRAACSSVHTRWSRSRLYAR